MHTAFLTASSTAAAAIAPASISLYLGDIPFDTTRPCVEPCTGASNPASPGPSLSTPTKGFTAVWAMTSWSYWRTHVSLLAMFGRANIRIKRDEWFAFEGGLNSGFVGGFHSLSRRNCGTPSCKNSIGSDATVSSPWTTWNCPVSVKSATQVASTSCKCASASNAGTSLSLTATVILS